MKKWHQYWLSGRAIIICVAWRTQLCVEKASSNWQPDLTGNSTEQYPLIQKRIVKSTCTEINICSFGVLFSPFILFLAYISYCLLCSLRTQTFLLCSIFFICVQTVKLIFIGEAWAASTVFLPASVPGSSQKKKICLWVSCHCMGVWLDMHLEPQKWKKCSSVTEFM